MDRDRTTGFTAYVAARRATLRRSAFLITGDWHAAEDLVQIALAKLYVAWPRIHTDGAEDAYVRRIMVRAHIDETRRPWRRREQSGLDGIEVAVEPSLPYEDAEALLTALATLPDRQRVTVVLRYWWGLSIEETANDLGCSTGTVKSQSARAVASLRIALSTDPAHR